MTTMESTMAATDKRRALLALVKLADQEAKWLQFTDPDGEQITMPPEQVRDLAGHRYYQDQNWTLVSPLDLIGDKAEILRMAHDVFQRTRISVTAWFTRRVAADRISDEAANPTPSKDNDVE